MFVSICVIYLIRIYRDIIIILDKEFLDIYGTLVILAKAILTLGICVSLHGRLSVAVSVANQEHNALLEKSN